jgi:hypothetical protein
MDQVKKKVTKNAIEKEERVGKLKTSESERDGGGEKKKRRKKESRCN